MVLDAAPNGSAGPLPGSVSANEAASLKDGPIRRRGRGFKSGRWTPARERTARSSEPRWARLLEPQQPSITQKVWFRSGGSGGRKRGSPAGTWLSARVRSLSTKRAVARKKAPPTTATKAQSSRESCRERNRHRNESDLLRESESCGTGETALGFD